MTDQAQTPNGSEWRWNHEWMNESPHEAGSLHVAQVSPSSPATALAAHHDPFAEGQDDWDNLPSDGWDVKADTVEQPPDYKPAAKRLNAPHCGSCLMYNAGKCWGYGNKRVKWDYVCDSYSPSKKHEAATTGTTYDEGHPLGQIAARHPNVDLFATEHPEGLRLKMIQVAPEHQRQGYAGAALQDLLSYADQQGKPVALNPGGVEDRPGMSEGGIRNWYKSYGFVPNKGRNKDYAFTEAMIRPADNSQQWQVAQPQTGAQEVDTTTSSFAGDSDWNLTVFDGQGPVSTCHVGAEPDELFIALNVPKPTADEIFEWAKKQDWPKGTELENPSEYHITLLYSPKGHKEHREAEWWATDNSDGIEVKELDEFPSQERGELSAFVLRVDTHDDEIKTRMERLLDKAEDEGVEVNRYPGGSKPHITVAYGPKLPKGIKTPDITFSSDEAHCGTPRTSSLVESSLGEVEADWLEEGEEWSVVASSPQDERHGANDGEQQSSGANQKLNESHEDKGDDEKLAHGSRLADYNVQVPVVTPNQGVGLATPHQVGDLLSLQNVAHNLHYKFEQSGLDPTSAQQYASRLLQAIGYTNPDQPTIAAAIQAWQTMYPDDSRALHMLPGQPTSHRNADIDTSEVALDWRDSDAPTSSEWEVEGLALLEFGGLGASQRDSALAGVSDEWSSHGLRVAAWTCPECRTVNDECECKHYYGTGEDEHDSESFAAARQARGNPDALVTIHRAAPINQINPGDWVSLSHGYAKKEGMHPTDPKQDMKVWSARVPASTIYWDGNSINEMGYHGPAIQGQRFYRTLSNPEFRPGSEINTEASAGGAGSKLAGFMWADSKGNQHGGSGWIADEWEQDEDDKHAGEAKPLSNPSRKSPAQARAYTHEGWSPSEELHRFTHSLIHQSDSWDTRQWPDPMSDLGPRPVTDHAKQCTCKHGDKLHCPVHGLEANGEVDDMAWSIPEGSPVGYPQDQPRQWTQAVSSLATTSVTTEAGAWPVVPSSTELSQETDAKTNSQANESRAKQGANHSGESDEQDSGWIDESHASSIAQFTLSPRGVVPHSPIHHHGHEWNNRPSCKALLRPSGLRQSIEITGSENDLEWYSNDDVSRYHLSGPISDGTATLAPVTSPVKVVHVDHPEDDDGPHPNYDDPTQPHRLDHPVLYHPDSNTLYVGQPGDYHNPYLDETQHEPTRIDWMGGKPENFRDIDQAAGATPDEQYDWTFSKVAQTMYHWAPKGVRQQIGEQGLRAALPEGDEYVNYNNPEAYHGVYMFHNPPAYNHGTGGFYGDDLWAVDTEGLNPQEDPGEWDASMVPHDISPDRIRYLNGQAHKRAWEKYQDEKEARPMWPQTSARVADGPSPAELQQIEESQPQISQGGVLPVPWEEGLHGKGLYFPEADHLVTWADPRHHGDVWYDDQHYPMPGVAHHLDIEPSGLYKDEGAFNRQMENNNEGLDELELQQALQRHDPRLTDRDPGYDWSFDRAARLNDEWERFAGPTVPATMNFTPGPAQSPMQEGPSPYANVRSWQINVGTDSAEHVQQWMMQNFPDVPMRISPGLGAWEGEGEPSTGIVVYNTPPFKMRQIVQAYGEAHPGEDAFAVVPLPESRLVVNPSRGGLTAAALAGDEVGEDWTVPLSANEGPPGSQVLAPPRGEQDPLVSFGLGRSHNSSLSDWAPVRKTAHQLGWQPGEYGKGLIHDGQVHTWGTGADEDGDPTHPEYASEHLALPEDEDAYLNSPTWNTAFGVNPQGHVNVYEPQHAEQLGPQIESADPRLKLNYNTDYDWNFSTQPTRTEPDSEDEKRKHNVEISNNEPEIATTGA